MHYHLGGAARFDDLVENIVEAKSPKAEIEALIKDLQDEIAHKEDYMASIRIRMKGPYASKEYKAQMRESFKHYKEEIKSWKLEIRSLKAQLKAPKGGKKVKREWTKQQAYQALNDRHAFWDRKDKNHIWVATSGYKTAEAQEIEKMLMKAGMMAMKQKFDRMSGKTMTTYRHD